MLAQRIVGLLPELAPRGAGARRRSVVAGLLPAGLSRMPPLVAPHHSTSMAALVGGGSGLAKPGAVSLLPAVASLFLDDSPEGSAPACSTRAPLERQGSAVPGGGTVYCRPGASSLAWPCAWPDAAAMCPSLVQLTLSRGPKLSRSINWTEVDLRRPDIYDACRSPLPVFDPAFV